MLFLPLLGAECRAGKEGNFAPSGQRGRENRDLAEQRSARTRLSLRQNFPQNPRCFCFVRKRKATKQRCMGRCHELTEGIRVNPQKGRHLLCTFCPCKKRKQGETSRRRERKETGSQPYGVSPVSVLYNLSAESSLHFFREKM